MDNIVVDAVDYTMYIVQHASQHVHFEKSAQHGYLSFVFAVLRAILPFWFTSLLTLLCVCCQLSQGMLSHKFNFSATYRCKPTLLTEHRLASVSRGEVALSTPCAVYIILISHLRNGKRQEAICKRTACCYKYQMVFSCALGTRKYVFI